MRARHFKRTNWSPADLSRLSDDDLVTVMAQAMADRSDLAAGGIGIANRIRNGATAEDLERMLREAERRRLPLSAVGQRVADDAFAGRSFISNLAAPPSWRRYEIHAASAVLQMLHANGIRVDRHEFDARPRGKISGGERQVDLLLVRDRPLHVVACEFKNHRRRVGIERVESLAAKLRDIGANRGALFSQVGFQRGAERLAAASGIDLFRFREVTREEATGVRPDLDVAPTYWILEGPGGLRGVVSGSLTPDTRP